MIDEHQLARLIAGKVRTADDECTVTARNHATSAYATAIGKRSAYRDALRTVLGCDDFEADRFVKKWT